MLVSLINPSDINIIEDQFGGFSIENIEGVYPVRRQVPAVGGYEGVGEVHSIGSSVKGLSPGDLVIPSPPSSGMWQTFIVKDQSVWYKINKDVPLEYAATVTVNPLTALECWKTSPLQNGATSIVGQCIIQLAKDRGVHSVNIVRDRAGSDEVKEKLKKLGADQVFTESKLQIKDVKGHLGDIPEPALGITALEAMLLLWFLNFGGVAA